MQLVTVIFLSNYDNQIVSLFISRHNNRLLPLLLQFFLILNIINHGGISILTGMEEMSNLSGHYVYAWKNIGEVFFLPTCKYKGNLVLKYEKIHAKN
jgi:hypothetical protein